MQVKPKQAMIMQPLDGQGDRKHITKLTIMTILNFVIRGFLYCWKEVSFCIKKINISFILPMDTIWSGLIGIGSGEKD